MQPGGFISAADYQLSVPAIDSVNGELAELAIGSLDLVNGGIAGKFLNPAAAIYPITPWQRGFSYYMNSWEATNQNVPIQ